MNVSQGSQSFRKERKGWIRNSWFSSLRSLRDHSVLGVTFCFLNLAGLRKGLE